MTPTKTMDEDEDGSGRRENEQPELVPRAPCCLCFPEQRKTASPMNALSKLRCNYSDWARLSSAAIWADPST